MKKVLAVILGGGRGTRLYPLTKLRAKPAVPIGGRFRLIDIPISNCLHAQIRKIYILTQFNTASLHRHITGTYKFDRFSEGFLHVLAAQQTFEISDWYEGTADSVRKNLNYIKNQRVDHVIILSGDQLYRINLSELVEYHKEKGAEITIASHPVSREMTGQLGILKANPQWRITRFAEKPTDPSVLEELVLPLEVNGSDSKLNFIASMGIYVFNKQVLLDLLEGNLKEDFGKEIIPDAIHTHRVFAYIFNGYWEDIGTIGSFFEANLDFASSSPKFNFYDEQRPIYTRARALPGAKISASHLSNTILCPGSIIEQSEISESVIGIRSRINRNCRLRRVVMMGADRFGFDDKSRSSDTGIGRDCQINNAILDKNVRIGDGVNINYTGASESEDRGDYYIRNGIVVIPKNAVIPDFTEIIT